MGVKQKRSNDKQKGSQNKETSKKNIRFRSRIRSCEYTLRTGPLSIILQIYVSLGIRKIFDPGPKYCLFRKIVYPNQDTVNQGTSILDTCTDCICRVRILITSLNFFLKLFLVLFIDP